MTDWPTSQAADLEFWRKTWASLPPAARKLSPAAFAQRLAVMRLRSLYIGHRGGIPSAQAMDGAWILEPCCGPVPLCTAMGKARRRVALDPLLTEYGEFTGRKTDEKLNGVFCKAMQLEDFDWWRNHPFDFILLSDGLGHLEDAEKGMNTAMSVLSVEGAILLDEPLRSDDSHCVRNWPTAPALGNWLTEHWGNAWTLDYVRVARIEGEKDQRMFTCMRRRQP